MRCLYCGKELALLKRWTRGGQFCSEVHKQSYQEEYNRMGLSRLLQAQTKPAPVAASKTQDSALNSNGPAPLHEAPVAVEEIPPEEVNSVEEPPQETLGGQDENLPEESVWEPAQLAGLTTGEVARPDCLDTLDARLEIRADAEPWDGASSLPVPPEWRSRGEVQQALPRAAMVELKLRPGLSDSEHPAPEVNATPNEFVHSQALPRAAEAGLANRIASAGLVKRTILPSASECSAASSVDIALSVALETEYRTSSLLQLVLSQVAFSEAEADVVLAPEAGVAAPVEDSAPKQAEDADQTSLAAAGDTAALADEAILWSAPGQEQPESQEADQAEAPDVGIPSLAQLHEGLNQFDAPDEPDQVDEQNHVDEPTEAPDTPAAEASAPAEMLPEVAADGVEAQHDQNLAPRSSRPPVEIPVKKLAPLKPALKEGAEALIEMPVFLPRLTGLPLRPKMGAVAAVTAAGPKKGTRSAAQSVQPAAETKPVAEVQPAAESKPEAEPQPDSGAAAKTAQRTAWRPPAEAVSKTTTPPARPAEKAAAAVKVEPAAPDKGRQENQRAGKSSGLAEGGKKTAAVPEVKTVEAAFSEPEAREIEAPHFGVSTTEKPSLLSSFTVKLAIAAALVALCITIYFVSGGKPQAPAVNPVADKAGPSIMVGSGGWVEGWAGDPADAHYGRQITIYRPSLKLSDYRIEFKGDIETKSLGWVFRAADPENYYAMKLAIVTPGLQPKIALLKYVVQHGRETQAGRVPIDLDVQFETLYSVRVDVRGPKFTTYVQGQQVDTWTDDQLKSGGVGFLNEREERGRIKSVSVSLLSSGK